MKEFGAILLLFTLFAFSMGEMGLWSEVKQTASKTRNYEYKSLELAKALREERRRNALLTQEIAGLKAKHEHLLLAVRGEGGAKALSSQNLRSRAIASIEQKGVEDLVDFELYRWSPEKLLGVGQQALHFKKYDKSAQFYNTLIEEYPNHPSVNDKVLFEAGLAAYESKKHFDWAAKHFAALIDKHPKSDFYRGAKLWMALAQFHQGDHENFVATVEEFRSKYRNTKEWGVLSRFYEDIAFRYSKR